MAEPNFENRTLFHGDNLEFLRGMNSDTVDLVATDPPFNKGRDFHATPDSVASGASFQDRWSWDRDVHEEWVDKLANDWTKTYNVIQGSRNSYGNDMGAFLCFMAVRLIEMRRVLKPTGAIYLHCDPTASHYLKELMDAIFGRHNFRNEVVWKRTNAPTASPYQFGSVHDKLLFYGMSPATRLRPIFIPYTAEYIAKNYKKKDHRGPFHPAPLTAQGIRHGDSGRPWRGVDVTGRSLHWVCPTALPKGLSLPDDWRSCSTQEKLDWLDAKGMIYWPPKGSMPRFKRYLSTVRGTRASDVMIDIPAVMGGSNENTGYPTQKPLALYERIISTSSDEGDVVLDPFCGCATTPVAAERLGRQWVGMDIWDKAHEVVLDRLRDEGLIADGKAATGRLLTTGQVHYLTEPPIRTDANEETIPFLAVQQREKEPSDGMSNAQRKVELLHRMRKKYNGKLLCEGCFREFDHERYFVLDHVTPRSYGGSNNIGNRMLLCWPCNRDKSDDKTVGGLHKMNLKAGTMKPGVVREDVTTYRKRVATKR